MRSSLRNLVKAQRLLNLGLQRVRTDAFGTRAFRAVLTLSDQCEQNTNYRENCDPPDLSCYQARQANRAAAHKRTLHETGQRLG